MNIFSDIIKRECTDIDKLYRILQSRYHKYRHKWVLSKLDRIEILVDLGCGDASLGRRTLEEGRTETYVGVDYSEHALKLADVNLSHLKGRYRLIQGDITDTYKNVPVEQNSVDAVSLVEVLERTPYPNRVLAGAAGLLRPQGLLLLTSPCRYDKRDVLNVSHSHPYLIEKILRKNRVAIKQQETLYTRPASWTDKNTGRSIPIEPRQLSYLIMGEKF